MFSSVDQFISHFLITNQFQTSNQFRFKSLVSSDSTSKLEGLEETNSHLSSHITYQLITRTVTSEREKILEKT